MRILLIAGGWSNEREVSLSGARSISESLIKLGHEVVFFDPADSFGTLLSAASGADFAFINLHGSPGEDGLIQAMLESVGCPYQGSGPSQSFLALNKAASKQIFRRAGLLTADWEHLPMAPKPDWEPSLSYPLFVKDNTGGSSLNLARVTNRQELDIILAAIFAAGREAIIEPHIIGQEVTCGILGDEALPPVLIRPAEGDFFNYASKYKVGGAIELCPAPLPEALTAKVQSAALSAHRALGLHGYSRSDFIITDTEHAYLLETNTLPGMTPTSLIPQEAAAMGMSFEELLERLISIGKDAPRQSAS